MHIGKKYSGVYKLREKYTTRHSNTNNTDRNERHNNIPHVIIASSINAMQTYTTYRTSEIPFTSQAFDSS